MTKIVTIQSIMDSYKMCETDYLLEALEEYIEYMTRLRNTPFCTISQQDALSRDLMLCSQIFPIIQAEILSRELTPDEMSQFSSIMTKSV